MNNHWYARLKVKVATSKETVKPVYLKYGFDIHGEFVFGTAGITSNKRLALSGYKYYVEACLSKVPEEWRGLFEIVEEF